jgi:hypothetical protein
LSDVEFVVEADGYTRKDFTEFFFMNHWILENVSMIDFTDKIVKHNIAIGRLEKPSLIFRKIYENINSSSENKYVLAMQDLNNQMYDLMMGNRKEIVDYKQFNLPFTDVSVEFSYIYKVCVLVFESDYINFLISVGKELNLDIPDDIVNQFKEKLDSYKNTFSPKYDKFYQIRTYYERVVGET